MSELICHFCQILGGRDPQIGLKCGVCFSCALERGSVFDACMMGNFDFEKYTADGGKQSGTMVQTLILSKDRFKTQESAVDWIVSNGFGAEKIDETEESFRFRQRDPGDFDPNGFGQGEGFRSIILSDGVTAVIGFLAEGKAAHTRPLNADGSCPTGFSREGNICVRKRDNQVRKRRVNAFVKIDDEKRLVSGPVLVPDVRDLQGDFEFREDIEKAAHGFMMNRTRKIGEMHQIFEGIGDPVESHILRIDTTFKGGKRLPAGAWIMTVKVSNNATWQRVKSGRITGFSIGFRGMRSSVKGAIAVAGGKSENSKVKAISLFHLHDIDVHEVSLVDRGAIDEVFTEVKQAEPSYRKAAGEKWIVSVIRDRIKSGDISAETVEKAGIKSGGEASDAELLAIAKAVGLDGVDPNGEVETMNTEELKKFVAGLLEPLKKSLGDLTKDLKTVTARVIEDAKEAEAEKKKKAEKAKLEKEKKDKGEGGAGDLTEINKALKEIKAIQEEMVKDTRERFEELEKLVGAKSEKISGQDEEEDKKKSKWPSFSGRRGR